MLRIDVHSLFHVFQQLLVRVHNFHCASAKHIRWTYKHRISKGLCSAYSIINRGYRTSLRLSNVKLGQKRFEFLTILRFIDAFQGCTDNFNARSLKRSGQIDCRLSAELYDYAYRLLFFNHVHYILEEQWLKVEAI
ncbi:hypothetical protein D3C71_1719050 [compost metagenome]